MTDEITALRARIAELEQAVKPFVMWIDEQDSSTHIKHAITYSDDCPVLNCNRAEVTFRDFRRLAAAIRARKESR